MSPEGAVLRGDTPSLWTERAVEWLPAEPQVIFLRPIRIVPEQNVSVCWRCISYNEEEKESYLSSSCEAFRCLSLATGSARLGPKLLSWTSVSETAGPAPSFTPPWRRERPRRPMARSALTPP